MMYGPSPPQHQPSSSATSQPRREMSSDNRKGANSDKISGSRKQGEAERMSGVAQNLQMFIQVVQGTGTSMFDQPGQFPRIPPTVSRRRESVQNTIQHDEEIEEMIVHYPYKRAQSTIELVQNPSCPSERSNSKKQVRFDIRESLKEIMAQVENDENNSGISNNVPVYQPISKPKLNQTKRIQDQRSRSKSLEGSKSPQGSRRQPSNESGKSGKPPKLGQFKTRQLALKYKVNAEEMRRKKFGQFEPQPLLVQEESTYSTIVSGGTGPHDDSRETPNFSVALSKRDINEDYMQSSPERVEEPPMPTELNPPELMQIPTSLDAYEEINHPVPKAHSPTNRERTMGMIVRNKGTVQSQVFNYNHGQRENSQNSSRMSNYQPGVIVRQRSQSPIIAPIIQFQNQAKKILEAPQVGLIVRNSSQQQLQVAQSMPNILIQPRLATSPGSSQRQAFRQIQQSHYVLQETQLTDSAAIRMSTPSLQDSLVERFQTHVHGTVWDLLNLPPSESKHQIMQIQQNSHGLRQHLLQVLISSQARPQFKLAKLRHCLSKLVISTLTEDLENIIYLRERRDQRLNDLKKVLKSMKKSPSQHDQLKSELLRDIVDRLNQKLALQILKINCQIKREIYLNFEIYYIDYIARDYLQRSIAVFKTHLQKTEHKREYLNQVKSTLQTIHLKHILSAWRCLRPSREAQSQLLATKLSAFTIQRTRKLLTFWFSHTQSSKLKLYYEDLVGIFRQRKLCQELFLRWAAGIRQQNRIKRLAIHRVAHGGASGWVPGAEEERLSEGLRRVQVKYDKEIRPWVKRIREVKAGGQREIKMHVQEIQGHKQRGSGSAQSRQRRVTHVEFRDCQMFDAQIDLRRTSMDVDLKYNIHQALVMQQNAQKQRAQSAQRQLVHSRFTNHQEHPSRRRPMSFISDGESFKRSLSNERPQLSKPVINTFFKHLEQANLQNTYQEHPEPHQFHSEPLIDRVKSHAFGLVDHQRSLDSLSYNHHFVVSLRANAHDVVNKQDFSGFTDYIQYGLASRVNRLVFQRMFKTKAMSVLFTQWRKRYIQKQFKKSIQNIHTVHLGKQSLIEWHRYLQQRKLWVKDFQRTKHIERFYSLFRRWSQANRQLRYEGERDVIRFRKRMVFNGWLRHLQRQGDRLVKVLKGQNYHSQSLMTKALLSLYQNYLQGIRVRQFNRYHTFRKYFKKIWMRKYQRQKKLKSVIIKLGHKESLLEREKYLREFELKKYTIQVWNEQAKEKRIEIKIIAADTHHKQNLVIKTFFYMKKLWQTSIGVKRLQNLVKNTVYREAFQNIINISQGLKSSEIRFKNYQTQVGLARIFMGWKEHSIQMKLSRLFFKKLILKHLYTYVMTKNHLLPKNYRIRKLQSLFLKTLALQVRAKWNEKRSDIILRQLSSKRKERQLKVSFLKLLENVLRSKQERLVDATVCDFRRNVLCQKALRVLKRKWLKKKKHRLMNRVAQDFSNQRESKKVEILRESLISSTQDYEVVKLRELQVFEDPMKMRKYHVLVAWKMYIQDKLRRDTVLDRYLLFKRRMLTLRCFLGWRSVAKYEQSSGYATSAAQHSRALSSSSRHEVYRGVKAPSVAQIASTREQSPGTKRDSSQRVRSVTHRDKQGVRFAETRAFLFDAQPHMLSGSNSSVRDHQQSGAASATFGMRSIASKYESIDLPPVMVEDTPRECQLRSTQFLQERSKDSGAAPLTSSLFDELENIFQKNRKWLDEQREREEFLREMASHYNQRLSFEMNSIRQSQDEANRYPSLMTLSLTSRR